MGFITPIFFLLTLFLLIVIFMYFFRKQYEKRPIPSVLLWQEWMNEFEAQAWWKKLQHHLLLYLQLIALLLLIFTLTQPFFEKKGPEGDHFIFIFDTSASMTTLEGEKQRLEIAKEQALDTLEQINNQDVTLIVADQTPNVIEERSNSKRNIVQFVENMQPTYAASNLYDSIELAKGLIGDEKGQIYVFTDNLADSNEFTFHENTIFTVNNIGKSTDNLSLGTFAVTVKNGEVLGVATIRNEGESSKSVDLKVFAADEQIIDISETVESGQEKTIYLEDLELSKMYRAEITGDSSYLLDNQLYSFLGNERETTIYLHDKVHPFVKKAVEIASNNVVHLTNSGTNSSLEGIHFIKGTPMEDWPQGPKFVFTPFEDDSLNVHELSKEILVEFDHPLLHLVDLEEVYIDKAQVVDLEGLEVLAKSGDIPLLFSGVHEGYPIVVLGFEIEDSDWPLLPSFPLFLYNSIQYLSQGQDLLGYYYPGDWLEYSPSADTKQLEIVDAAGNVEISSETFDHSIQLPVKPGLYTFRETKESQVEERYLTIMLDEEEKSISSEDSFSISAGDISDGEEAISKLEVSTLFLLFALLVLLLEWEVYRRAISN